MQKKDENWKVFRLQGSIKTDNKKTCDFRCLVGCLTYLIYQINLTFALQQTL